jgi:hypothetical protein
MVVPDERQQPREAQEEQGSMLKGRTSPATQRRPGSKTENALGQQPPETSLTRITVATFKDSPDDTRSTALAMFASDPNSGAAAVMALHGKILGCGLDELNALAAQLDEAADKVLAGDMKRAEEMLFAQANALQSIFVELATRATRQEYLKNWDAYLRMALKAQNQCRMTLETLSTVKNPPTVFAKQANINNGGQQQVNNGAAPAYGQPPARAANDQSAPTELLEHHDGQRMDTGAQGTSGRADPQLATVGEVHGATDRRRKSASVAHSGSGRTAGKDTGTGQGSTRRASGAR